MAKPRYTTAQWEELLKQPPLERGYFTDEEAVHASGVEVGSLRALAVQKGITACQEPLPPGRLTRMWPTLEVLKAAVAGAMNEHLGLSFKVAGGILALIPDFYWQWVFDLKAILNPKAIEAFAKSKKGIIDGVKYIFAKDTDWHLQLYNNAFLFLSPSEKSTGKRAASRLSRMPLAEILPDGRLVELSAAWFPFKLDALEALPKEQLEALAKHSGAVATARKNFISLRTINVSMPMRLAACRAAGHEVRFSFT